ncbi:MAG: ABC transporter ATP-binding protein [Phycisphaerales bacterium]|jgi:iron complex transport system ATP-binding protein|nr:ABC transporter ATP-binding protein [Phycisphaerales bacterium]
MPIALDNVSVSLGPSSREVLRGVSLSLAPARLLAVLGPNGAGKTTLLRVMAGLLPPSSGRATLDGHDLARIPEPERARRVALVPQRSDLAFPFSVRDYVRFGARAGGPAADALVDPALELLELSARSRDAFTDLSAGQQQRATLARALVQLRAVPGRPIEPAPARVLLADEPIGAMDPRHAARSMEVLVHLARAGLGVVVVLHDFTLAARHADDVLLLTTEGRVHASAPATEALEPESLREAFGVPFIRHGSGENVALVPARAPLR